MTPIAKRRAATAQRAAALRERRAALGLVRVEVWARPDDVERIRAYARAREALRQLAEADRELGLSD